MTRCLLPILASFILFFTYSQAETLRDTFDRQGYLVIENFWSEEECATARQRAADMLDAYSPGDVLSMFDTASTEQMENDYFLGSYNTAHLFFEPEAFNEQGELVVPKEMAINKIGHGLHECDPIFSRLTFSGKTRDLLAELGYCDPVCAQSMLIFKPPRIGGAVPLHQDCSFLWSEPDTLIGLWIALEDVTVENSCLWILPGGHVIPRWMHYGRSESHEIGFLWQEEPPINEADLVPVEVKAGSLVVIHSHIPHMSLANRSDRSRWIYTFHCFDSPSTWSKVNWLQRLDGSPFPRFYP